MILKGSYTGGEPFGESSILHCCIIDVDVDAFLSKYLTETCHYVTHLLLAQKTHLAHNTKELTQN